MAKRLVICSDGTWGTPNLPRPTNVVKMARAISPLAADGTHQVIFYDAGVGTHRGLDRVTGGAFGHGLDKNIEDCYRFIINNYMAGDEIFFFGFSRGAYTVRSTAGLIRNSGILYKHYGDRFPEAYELYRSRTVHPNSAQARSFRQVFAREATIKFMGVWDTVGSLGIPRFGMKRLASMRYLFHDVQLSRSIENAFQALAIDEKRKPFTPTLWEAQDDPAHHQTVEQVWFPGAHGNIGGGPGPDDDGISDTTFMWMKQKAEGCGLAFDETFIKQEITPNYMGHIQSPPLVFWLAGLQSRIIGAGQNTKESLHESVLQRLNEKSLAYQPTNVLTYQQQQKK